MNYFKMYLYLFFMCGFAFVACLLATPFIFLCSCFGEGEAIEKLTENVGERMKDKALSFILIEYDKPEAQVKKRY